MTTPGVKITTTSRRVGSQVERRAMETVVRPSTVADYQMIADENITYGSAATTYGKIYAGGSGATAKSVTHGGTDLREPGDLPRAGQRSRLRSTGRDRAGKRERTLHDRVRRG